MNNQRRKALAKLVDRLSELEALRASILEELQDVANEEREAFEAMPESLQESERGQTASEAADKLEEAVGELEGFDIESLSTMIEEAQA